MIREVLPMVDNDWAKAKQVVLWSLEEFGPKSSKHLFKINGQQYMSLPNYYRELKKQVQEL